MRKEASVGARAVTMLPAKKIPLPIHQDFPAKKIGKFAANRHHDHHTHRGEDNQHGEVFHAMFPSR